MAAIAALPASGAVGRDAAARWFWTPEQAGRTAAFIRDEMPGAHAAALDDAQRVMEHRFPHSCAPTVVRYVQLTPGFSFMDNPTGDRQFLYTLHRHLFWEQLATAYVLTGDERYAVEWAGQARRWLDECPLPITEPEVRKHEMWCGLDAGIRAYRWAWPYHAFQQSPAFTPDLRHRWHEHWAEHARFLRRHHAPVGSNWCTMQMYGLLTAALYGEKLEDSAELRDYAVQTLIGAIRAQIRPDGVQVEQSPSYHVGCIGWFAEPMRLAELNGMTFPGDYRERIDRMCAFARWIMAPGGLLPALSDTDRSEEGKYALATGAALLGRSDLAAPAEATARHALMFGPAAVRPLLSAGHPGPASRSSEPHIRTFRDAGYVVMRSGWDDRAAFTVFDCGPRGGGHGHYDLLSIEVQAFGRLLIADPGRWWYDDSALRRELVGTPAHNTISLDGVNHAGLEHNPNNEYELVNVETRDGWTHVCGRHRAYTDMNGPPLIERQVLYDGKCVWILIDRIEAPDPHDVLINFQFAPEPVRCISATMVTAGEPDEPRIVLAHQADAEWTAALEPSTISLVYGQKQPATRLRLRARGSRVEHITALHAFEASDAPSISVARIPGDGNRIRVQIAGDVRTLQLSDSGDGTVVH